MTRKTAAAPVATQPDLLGTPAAPKLKAASKKKPAQEAGKFDKPAASNEIAVIKPVDPRNMLTIIANAAADPNVDVGKMQALLSMQKEIMAEQARLDFTAAFLALKVELPVINRDGKIVIVAKDADGKRREGGRIQQSTPYATFENISRVIDPLMAKHGFTLSFATEPSPDGTRIHVKGILDHISGHQRSTIFPLPAETTGSKNNVQGWGSSFSYGKRYATVALLNIRTAALEDRDTDGHVVKRTKGGAPQIIDGDVVVDGGRISTDEGVEKIDEKQHDDLIEMLEACSKKPAEFCHAWKIDKVADLPAEFFPRAMKALKDLKAKHG